MLIEKLFDLSGKRALITGGGGGIGLASAKVLAQAGAQIILSDINEQYLMNAVGELKTNGIDAQYMVTDISLENQVASLFEFLRQGGGIDILVHTAATINRKLITETTRNDWDQVIATNLSGAFLVSKATAIAMQEQNRGGSMVFVLSTGASRASERYGSYSAGKAGVVMLVKTLALELAQHRIRVNAFAPTVTNTRFVDEVYSNNPERLQQAIKNHPLGRIATPEDYDGTVLYLVSSASEFVTGQVITVDGGKTLK